jgi:NADPH:quinone reductase-like Zn-dependent oxidoreductase
MASSQGVAFDAVGGSYVDTLAQALAHEATIYLYGPLSGEATNYPVSAFVKSIFPDRLHVAAVEDVGTIRAHEAVPV